ncbi:MAG: hypothetical protein CL893_03795 [Dehalococcoidia bacterium]|nr:hypothetical protein [Dehalococcoidia bacterium]
MENNNNNLWQNKILGFIQNRNFFLYILLFSLIIISPIMISSVRQNFGIAPILISGFLGFILIYLRYSIINSFRFLSTKTIFSVILFNLSIYIFLGSIDYVSSSNFSFDYSLSGKNGETLAKWPSFWNSYSANFLNYLDLIIRILLPILLIFFLHKPQLFKKSILNMIKFVLKEVNKFLKKIKIPQSNSNNKNESLITSENVNNKASITEKAKSRKNEPLNDPHNISSTKEIITENSNQFVLNKTISFSDNDGENDIDKFKIENLKWPKINTSEFMVSEKKELSSNEIEDTKKIIISTLSAHGVNTSIEKHTSGPSVTMYQLKPGWVDGNEKKRVKVEQVLRREKDLALALGSPNIRFEAVIDGIQNTMGIEIPNLSPNTVDFKEVIENEKFNKNLDNYNLPAPLGQGMDGIPKVIDLSKMPHLLVAGSTGSGKSVFINSIIAGLLTTKTPDDVRMILIDPKRVELTPYSKIPHLYTDEVIVDTDKAVSVLSATVEEMMMRFKILEKVGVKNITDFNNKMKNSHKMWNLLVVIDELADLMLQAGSEIERLIVRLAQLGRAIGIHLVVATQRPSVDVVTGLIKANFPSRVSFAVMSQIDSRTVLDSVGAEKLIGKGDMLFSPIDNAQMSRVQGVFLTENDIYNLTNQWEPFHEKYSLEMLEIPEDESILTTQVSGDTLYDQALDLSSQSKTLSTSLLQRRLRIGYPRAARLMDELEENGIVGPGEAGKPRKVLSI